MGILDKKVRFIDFVATLEGRRQLTSGQFKSEYISLTDTNVHYTKSDRQEDYSNKIYFEVMNKKENVITLEFDDSGKMLPYNFSTSGSILGDNSDEGGNKLFVQDATRINIHKKIQSTGSQFASLASDIEASFLNNFKNNHFIGTTLGEIQDKNEFSLNQNNVYFTINDLYPFKAIPNTEIININNAEPFILDSKLAHLPNFDFLPPVNIDGSNFGNYIDVRSTKKENWEDIIKELGNDAFFYKEGEIINSDTNVFNNQTVQAENFNDVVINPINVNIENTLNTKEKEYHTFNFQQTSFNNNIIMQMFEKNHARNSFKKLEIIDGGVFYVEGDINKRYEKQVYYVGKIFYDDYDAASFINLFTIIID